MTDPFEVGSGFIRFDAFYSGDRNFAVWAYGAGDGRELVFNESGPYHGQAVLSVGDPGSIFLAIPGIGPWEIRVSQLQTGS